MIPPSVRGLFQFDVVLMLSIFTFDFNAIKKWRVNICVTFCYKFSTTVFFCLCVLEKASFRNYNVRLELGLGLILGLGLKRAKNARAKSPSEER